MLIVDMKKSIPLDTSKLNWNPDHMTAQEVNSSHILTVPLLDERVKEELKQLVYNIASSTPWLWPDYGRTTLSLIIDVTRNYPRFSLRVGVHPAPPNEKVLREWKEYEEQRKEAIKQYEQNGGNEVFDTFPVMLAEKEEIAVKRSLFRELDLY